MTPREICEKIVEQGNCYGVSCFDDKCPFKDINCDIGKNFIGVKSAKQWLADNPKPILKDGDIRFGPADLKRMSEGLERINEENNMELDLPTKIQNASKARKQEALKILEAEKDNMDKYVEVDSIKEVYNTNETIYCKLINTNNYQKVDINEYDLKSCLLAEKYGVIFYKLNPDYCEFKEGQLVYNYRRDKLSIYDGSETHRKDRLPTEAELRTLVPQVYEQFVKELERVGSIEPLRRGDVTQAINALINKYRSE